MNHNYKQNVQCRVNERFNFVTQTEHLDRHFTRWFCDDCVKNYFTLL